MIFTVYIIENQHGVRYIGQTNNVILRLKSHNENKNSFTKNKGPWRIIYTESFDSRSAAMRWEKFLKQQKGGDGLKNIIGKNS